MGYGRLDNLIIKIKTMENIKSKPFWKSTSIISGTALLTLCLTLISLYYKAVGSNIGEVLPLVVLALGTYGFNVRGRVKADTSITLGDKNAVN